MSLAQLMSKQKAIAEILAKSAINYKKTAIAKRTKGIITERLAEAKQLWREYKSNHCSIVTLSQELTSEQKTEYDYISKDIFSEIEEKYFDFVGLLQDTLDKMQETTASSQADKEDPNSSSSKSKTSGTSQSTLLRLPRISIPSFSGSYESWRSFHDLFKALVHTNKELSAAQKLHYLKSSVTGEAEHLLRQFPITDASYESAWKVLLSRYDNKRVLVNTQLKLLFSLPKLNSESAKGIKTLLDKSSESLYELQALGVSTENWDAILIHMLVQRLPSETHKMWEENQKDSDQLATFEDFKGFLEKRFRTLEAISDSKPSMAERPSQQKGAKASTYFAASSDKCILCKEPHPLFKCPKFNNLDTNKRYQLVNSHHLCKNCLSKKHKLQACPSKINCRRCRRRHHSLLHKEITTETSQPVSPRRVSQSGPSIETHDSTNKVSAAQSFYTNKSQHAHQTLLATALVNLPSRTGAVYTLRALIDSGSQVSFITRAATKLLQLATVPTSLQITGLGGSEATKIKFQTTVEIRPSISEQKPTNVTAFVVQRITDLIPPETIATQDWRHIQDIPLADPLFTKPGKIDLLLGADIYGDIILEGLRKGPPGTPTAQNSIFGWIMFGPVSRQLTTPSQAASFVNVSQDSISSLDKLIRRFWECEEIQIEHRFTKEEQECEKIFEETHRRNESGRYEVRLPFKGSSPDLGDSRSMAIRRFFGLEKRLSSNPELYEEYRKCLNEYISMGHMKLLGKDAPKNPSYYLPHHAVIKDSTTTKVRVVFDASAKTSNGKSLNEQLYSGPVLQSDLFTILLRWRMYRYAMSADVEKMYRMINMHPSDQNFQRIFWRNNANEPLKEYVLTTVTFGTTPAPYLAIKSLQQLAKDEEANFPLAAKIVARDFYVDDLLTGSDSLHESQEIQSQIQSLLAAGGFNLRKWVSNSSDLLANLPESQREIKLPLRFASDESVKTLGIHWYPGPDYFTLQYRQITDCLNTKRSVLSEIATLFDPLGWISPIVVTAKILMQSLWLSGCSWDDPIPPSVHAKWQEFKSELHFISKIQIPRWLQTTKNPESMQLHGFSDASNAAYSAAVYMRVIDSLGHVHTNLIMAKSKVAPTKPVTLPRLELCGAHLLAKLLARVRMDLELPSVPTYAWTDSSIVLSWIHNQPRKYKTYVANRIAEIQELSTNTVWNHVSSADNPADCNSRGIKPSDLVGHTLWWNGPSWLQLPEQSWPRESVSVRKNVDLEEKRTTLTTRINPTISQLISKISSYPKLVRVVAYCFRFIKNCRRTADKRVTTSLTTSEIQSAKISVIKATQSEFFAAEINALKAKSQISSKSELLSLTPFLDSEGVLRVRGRLHNADLPYSQKHPIILPRKSHLTEVLITHVHQNTLHGGAQLVLATLRNEFWVMRGRNTVRHFIRKCTICWKQKAKTQTQIMGDLPAPRINMSRPFQHTGVDFAGPFRLTMSRHRGSRAYKGYICIFICLSTKAVHIEAVSDLSTAAFIAALRRFIGRRGLCTDIYSDCGTNFIGANKVLQEEFAGALREATGTAAEKFAHEGIQWHFNPPAAPHFGGLWEAGVKSIKHHLKRVLQNTLLTYEEFATVLAQIEACLNSRPLCSVSEDPDDFFVLTPGHFLIGTALKSIPETPTRQVSSIARWNHLQQLQNHFWSQWSKTYLNSLQHKTKWKTTTKNITVGDLVLLKESNLSPCCWVLGRITETHEGVDGCVRVVTIRTKSGTFKRPISKVALMPID